MIEAMHGGRAMTEEPAPGGASRAFAWHHALLADPSGDASLRIALREPTADGDTFAESTWLATGPNTFRLNRAKFAVADVTSDGKDDLIALYNESENKSGLFVFRSSGSSFSKKMSVISRRMHGASPNQNWPSRSSESSGS